MIQPRPASPGFGGRFQPRPGSPCVSSFSPGRTSFVRITSSLLSGMAFYFRLPLLSSDGGGRDGFGGAGGILHFRPGSPEVPSGINSGCGCGCGKSRGSGIPLLIANHDLLSDVLLPLLVLSLGLVVVPLSEEEAGVGF